MSRPTLASARHRRAIAALALAITGGLPLACSRGSDTPARDSAAMTAMPGMDAPASAEIIRDDTAGGTPREVLFSAIQVSRGGIAWRAPVAGPMSGGAAIPAQVVPNEDRTARLGAPAGGRVVAVRVAPGDRVARGQLLVSLQSPEAGMAQADLTKARAEVASRRAEATYATAARERAERLLALKAIPRQEYERAIADHELARASLAQAEAELRRAGSLGAQLGATASASGEIAIRSPLAGVVLARSAVPGTVVETGAPLVVVTDPSTLWLSITAPEKLASLFRVGGALRFQVPAYPADTFVARVTSVGASLDPATRTLPVRGLISTGARVLKPEMLASVTVASDGGASALLLPEDAVQLLDGRTIVFIARAGADGGATFIARQVEVGTRAGGFVSVTRGLSPDELVVTRGALTVKAQLQKGAIPMEM